jgi:DNA-binding response OmpR family regulator
LNTGSIIESAGYTITPHSVLHNGERVHLTCGENIILHTIAGARGTPVRRSDLGERADLNCNSIKPMVRNIRHKLPGVPIRTERGFGYQWSEPVEERHDVLPKVGAGA